MQESGPGRVLPGSGAGQAARALHHESGSHANQAPCPEAPEAPVLLSAPFDSTTARPACRVYFLCRGLMLPDGVFWFIPVRGSSARTLLQRCSGAWSFHGRTVHAIPGVMVVPGKTGRGSALTECDFLVWRFCIFVVLFTPAGHDRHPFVICRTSCRLCCIELK